MLESLKKFMKKDEKVKVATNGSDNKPKGMATIVEDAPIDLFPDENKND